MLTAALTLAGCGAKEGQKAGESSSAPTAKPAAEITIGTEGTYAPFTFHDKSGTLTGFDVEIAQEVAKRAASLRVS